MAFLRKKMKKKHRKKTDRKKKKRATQTPRRTPPAPSHSPALFLLLHFQHPKLWSHEFQTVPRPHATCATRAVASSIVGEKPSRAASAATSPLQEQPFLVKSRRAEQLREEYGEVF